MIGVEVKETGASIPPMESLTYDDLVAMPDDGLRHELIDGHLFVTPSPGTPHQRTSVRLTVAFAGYLASNPIAEVFHAPFDVLFTDRDVVQPDLVVILNEQREILTDKNVQGVPALVIEIVSDSRYDRVEKRRLYERFGVPEYWIVDPNADRVEILRLSDGTYGRPEILEAGDTLTFAPLPGLEISVGDLLAPS